MMKDADGHGNVKASILKRKFAAVEEVILNARVLRSGNFQRAIRDIDPCNLQALRNEPGVQVTRAATHVQEMYSRVEPMCAVIKSFRSPNLALAKNSLPWPLNDTAWPTTSS